MFGWNHCKRCHGKVWIDNRVHPDFIGSPDNCACTKEPERTTAMILEDILSELKRMNRAT